MLVLAEIWQPLVHIQAIEKDDLISLMPFPLVPFLLVGPYLPLVYMYMSGSIFTYVHVHALAYMCTCAIVYVHPQVNQTISHLSSGFERRGCPVIN